MQEDDSFQTTIPSQTPSSIQRPLEPIDLNVSCSLFRRHSRDIEREPSSEHPTKRVRLTLHPPKKRTQRFLRPPKPPSISEFSSSPLSSSVSSESLETEFSSLSSRLSDYERRISLHEDIRPQTQYVQTLQQLTLRDHRSQIWHEQQEHVRNRVYKAFLSEYIVETVRQSPQYMTDICNHCGALHWIEERVHRSSEYEPCCKQGDIKLDPFKSPPPLLQDLLTARDPVSRRYRKHIRQYNSVLAFTSVNYRADTRIAHQNRGPNSFMIQGDLYHMGGPLAASDNQLHFAQLFFYHPEEATTIRSARHSDLDPGVLRCLTDMLYSLNLHIDLYKTANETLRDNATSNNNLRVILTPQMQLVMEAGADRCWENLSTSNEVAAIIIDEYEDPCERDIVLTERVNGINGTSMKRISQNHAAYMSLHYVLLFPHGDKGWHWGLQINANSRQQIKNRLC